MRKVDSLYTVPALAKKGKTRRRDQSSVRGGRRVSHEYPRSKGATQDQENVGKDTSQHGRLNQSKLILLQSDDSDQELDGVSERSVQEGRDALGQAHAQLFGSISEQL